MKNILISLVVMSFVCVGTAQAITVENYSFEAPAVGKLLGWNGENGPDIPGWVGEANSGNSGIEDPLIHDGKYEGTDGLYAGLLGHVDPGGWNLTDHTIAAGEIFRLTVDASNTYTNPDRDLLFKVTLYYGDAVTRVEGESQTFTLPTGIGGDDVLWNTYSIVFDADSDTASYGNKVGIELANVTPVDAGDPSWGASWMIMDNVRLVPEPATMMLLSLGSLALIRRRRA